jgi:RimJ/RimL family protein N-acetyltransferase
MQAKKRRLKNRQVATIREAQPQDAARLLKYVNRVAGETDFLACGRGELEMPLDKERQFIEAHRDADNKLLIVAEVKGCLAGALGYTGDERKRLRHTGEFGIVVSRKYWGIGLGAALMDCLIEWAKSSDIVRKIGLRVRVDNDRAIGFYERFGFAREGRVTRQFALAGAFHDAYLMGLEIDPPDIERDAAG